MKLGSVPYLNAKPLLAGLDDARLAVPSVLAGWLRAGEVDAALVPVVEAIEHPHYWLLDGYGIACDGEVYSVFLARHGAGPLRRIALDPASRTSARLTRLLYGPEVDYVAPSEPADAQLLIGDPAIAYRHAHPAAGLIDLGEAWKQATGLPFVFAVWALRTPDAAIAARLREAAEQGLAARGTLAREPWQRRYLEEHIRYRLGERERAGLERFAQAIAPGWSPRWL